LNASFFGKEQRLKKFIYKFKEYTTNKRKCNEQQGCVGGGKAM